jgi:SAM-dependent methyltransferase
MDQAAWDERYRQTSSVWGAAPNVFVEQVLSGRRPGTALDLACGEGRNALWLAGRGWRVSAVDFSPVALDKGRQQAEAHGLDLDWIEADVTGYRPPPGAFDVVLIAYLHLPGTALEPVLHRAAEAVAPGGTLLVVGHDAANLAQGVGGPQDPEVLYTAQVLAGNATGLHIERAERVTRRVPNAERPALDTLLVAVRPKDEVTGHDLVSRAENPPWKSPPASRPTALPKHPQMPDMRVLRRLAGRARMTDFHATDFRRGTLGGLDDADRR